MPFAIHSFCLVCCQGRGTDREHVSIASPYRSTRQDKQTSISVQKSRRCYAYNWLTLPLIRFLDAFTPLEFSLRCQKWLARRFRIARASFIRSWARPRNASRLPRLDHNARRCYRIRSDDRQTDPRSEMGRELDRSLRDRRRGLGGASLRQWPSCRDWLNVSAYTACPIGAWMGSNKDSGQTQDAF